MIKTDYLPYAMRSSPPDRPIQRKATPDSDRYSEPRVMIDNRDRTAFRNDDVRSMRPAPEYLLPRPIRDLPAIIESGPPPPPTNVYQKDGMYQCPYVKCFARRVADKEVTVMTDCWERVSVWKRVKKPCRVRIPQYEPVCRTCSSNLPPMDIQRKHQVTSYPPSHVFNRNNDAILQANQRSQARAPGKLPVENVVNLRAPPQYEQEHLHRVPAQPRKVATTYSAPRKYDKNNDGILDAAERSHARMDGQLKIESRTVLPAENPARRVTYAAPTIYDVNNYGIPNRSGRQNARSEGYVRVQ